MYALKITVSKVLGTCTAAPPMAPGDHFTVRDGDIRIPAGGYVCLYALQSLLPLITPRIPAMSGRWVPATATPASLDPAATRWSSGSRFARGEFSTRVF